MASSYTLLNQSMTNIVEERSSARHQDDTNNPTEQGSTEREMCHPNFLLLPLFLDEVLRTAEHSDALRRRTR